MTADPYTIEEEAPRGDWRRLAEAFSERNGGCVVFVVNGEPRPAPARATDVFPKRSATNLRGTVNLDFVFYPARWRYAGAWSQAAVAENRAAVAEARR